MCYQANLIPQLSPVPEDGCKLTQTRWLNAHLIIQEFYVVTELIYSWSRNALSLSLGMSGYLVFTLGQEKCREMYDVLLKSETPCWYATSASLLMTYFWASGLENPDLATLRTTEGFLWVFSPSQDSCHRFLQVKPETLCSPGVQNLDSHGACAVGCLQDIWCACTLSLTELYPSPLNESLMYSVVWWDSFQISLLGKYKCPYRSVLEAQDIRVQMCGIDVTGLCGLILVL